MTNDVQPGGAPLSGLEVLCSSAAGAAILTVADVLYNPDSGTIERASTVLAEKLGTGPAGSFLLAIAVAIGIGVVLCYVFKPGTKGEAFARGASVFAVLATLSPPLPGQTGVRATGISGSHSFSGYSMIGRAHAQTNPRAKIPRGEAVIILSGIDKLKRKPVSRLLLWNSNRTKLVATTKARTSRFVIKRPAGQYLVEIDTPGFRLSQSKITLGKDRKFYAIHMTRSKVPVSIQKFYGRSTVRAVETPARAF